ncbi:uncharacterized protein LOC130720645 [Lotus japonicus]|uniref:uncharacterized protein LOC130720645 n=1 Tax=Lotus japonicus TaxID=34305 RepID=UPI0025864617|nr:uncharacterized protein LOC130720645 [Lotus japonicus]
MSRRLSPPALLDEPIPNLGKITFTPQTQIGIQNAFVGYDKVNDKYKVLAFGVEVGYGIIKMVGRLYTFGESNWRTPIQDLPFGVASAGWGSSWGSRQTLVNGNLHWLTAKGDGSGKWMISSLDVENETHGKLLLPPMLEDEVGRIDLAVSNSYLYVWQFSHKTLLVLWLMKDYGVQGSWTKVMTIPRKFHISRIPICRSNAPHHLNPLCILGNGLVVLRTPCSCSYLVTYDSKNGQFGRRCRIKRSSPRQWHGGIYHESLVSPP